MTTQGVEDDEEVASTPFALICAYLEDRGYRRDEIRNLSRFYVRRVIGWPRKKDGSLESPRRAERPLSYRETLRRIYFMRNYPLHRIEEVVEARIREANAK